MESSEKYFVVVYPASSYQYKNACTDIMVNGNKNYAIVGNGFDTREEAKIERQEIDNEYIENFFNGSEEEKFAADDSCDFTVMEASQFRLVGSPDIKWLMASGFTKGFDTAVKKPDRVVVHGAGGWGYLLVVTDSVDAAKTEISRLKTDDNREYDIYKNGKFVERVTGQKPDRIEIHGCGGWGLMAIVDSIEAAKTEIARLKSDDNRQYAIYKNGHYIETI
jgi:hypothetical protein